MRTSTGPPSVKRDEHEPSIGSTSQVVVILITYDYFMGLDTIVLEWLLVAVLFYPQG